MFTERCFYNKVFYSWKRYLSRRSNFWISIHLYSRNYFFTYQNNSSIKGIQVFDNVFLYTTYAYDSTFFLKNLASVKKLLDIFSCYSKHSGRKSNFSKCEIAGIGFLKGNDVTMCGIKCVNLQVNTIKILGIY